MAVSRITNQRAFALTLFDSPETLVEDVVDSGVTTIPSVGDLTEDVRLFLESVEARRRSISAQLDPTTRSRLGQVFTPDASAAFLAAMAGDCPERGWRLLDPGAGVGSLSAALIGRWLTETDRPEMTVLAYEIDPGLLDPLKETLAEARTLAHTHGRRLTTIVRHANFILSPPALDACNVVIMNPPYKKLNTQSPERRALENLPGGLRVTNLYAAFLVRAAHALERDGTLVAITPRSFANGPYFRDLRREMLAVASFERIHIFESRDRVFADSDVLQENLIFSMRVGRPAGEVILSSSQDAQGEVVSSARSHEDIVHPDDDECFVRLPMDDSAIGVVDAMRAFPSELSDLGLSVSTGRVVDFRSKDQLRDEPEEGTVPLVYPQNLRGGEVTWPTPGRKPQALVVDAHTTPMLFPNEHFVLVKRFTSKEEPRRVVAVVSSPACYPGPHVAFENHLNVFHERGGGLAPEIAAGLASFLNSQLVDDYVRQFNGHTQINATDLRRLRYPTLDDLRDLGKEI